MGSGGKNDRQVKGKRFGGVAALKNSETTRLPSPRGGAATDTNKVYC